MLLRPPAGRDGELGFTTRGGGRGRKRRLVFSDRGSLLLLAGVLAFAGKQVFGLRDLANVRLRFTGAHGLQFSDEVCVVVGEQRQTQSLSLDFSVGDEPDVSAGLRTLSEGAPAAPACPRTSSLPGAGVGAPQFAALSPPASSSSSVCGSFKGSEGRQRERAAAEVGQEPLHLESAERAALQHSSVQEDTQSRLHHGLLPRAQLTVARRRAEAVARRRAAAGGGASGRYPGNDGFFNSGYDHRVPQSTQPPDYVLCGAEGTGQKTLRSQKSVIRPESGQTGVQLLPNLHYP